MAWCLDKHRDKFILRLSFSSVCTVEKQRKKWLDLRENNDKPFVQVLGKYRKVSSEKFQDVSQRGRMLQNILNISLLVYTNRTCPSF
jgi:hypothetical protein